MKRCRDGMTKNNTNKEGCKSEGKIYIALPTPTSFYTTVDLECEKDAGMGLCLVLCIGAIPT